MNIWNVCMCIGGRGEGTIAWKIFRGPIMELVGERGYSLYGVCQGGGALGGWEQCIER